MSNKALSAWLSNILQVQCEATVQIASAKVILSDGREAFAEFDDECVSLYTLDAEDRPVYEARVRLVPETD